MWLLVGYSATFLISAMLLVYMRIKRHDAFKGDDKAARKSILPAFEPLLWLLALTTGAFSAFIYTALVTDFYSDLPPKKDTECFYAGRQFVFVIVLVVMHQKSVSPAALRRAVAIAFCLATFSIPIVWLLASNIDPAGAAMFWGQLGARSALQLFYVYVYIWPPVRASCKAIRQYCVFVFIYFVFATATLWAARLKRKSLQATLGYIALTWAAFAPLLIWRVLKADTEFWRGMGQRACALQHMTHHQMHFDERTSSRGLHVLIEMHRRFVIDFAHLELKNRIGTGANAVVLDGVLHSTTAIAAKVYTPQTFTEETIAAFSHEAALCATLSHPNVVKFYGMCVCPPTVCLVSELCRGNLEDVIVEIASRDLPLERQQNLINVMYMIDAARALAYIHSFSPPFLHRDIKPANFLVDMDNNVKLTDFGESRSLPRQHVTEASARQPTKLTVTGTVDYMAPEVVSGRAGMAAYGEAADVYSLAITFWDILNPGRTRYPHQHCNPMLIFETVIDGTRPDLDVPMHPSLRDLITTAWHSDPSARPAAQHIVSRLEDLQEELLATFALDLCDDFGRRGLPQIPPHPSPHKYFTGEFAIENMEDAKYIADTSEGIRVGNALMDAGFLHHLSHEQPFDDSDSIFFFDEANVAICQPLAILEAGHTANSDSSFILDERYLTDSLVSSEYKDGSNSSGGSEDGECGTQRKRGATGSSSSTSILSHFAAVRSWSKASLFTTNTGETPKRVDATQLFSSRCQCRRFSQRPEAPGHQAQHYYHRHQRKNGFGVSKRPKCAPIVEEEDSLERMLLEVIEDEMLGNENSVTAA